jgi:thiamine biosynthesis protein ThiI
MTSPEICTEIGGWIDDNTSLNVDVNRPNFTIMVEIRENSAFVYAKHIKGAGGLPVGTSGDVLLLLSGGIDSPVAGYEIAKRGCVLQAVHFFSYPYTSLQAKEKVIELAKILSEFSGEIKLHIVPFTDIQLEINKKTPPEQGTILMRRFMMKIACKLAENKGCDALVTGESLAQVASQTLRSIKVTDEVCNLPVFRPLIGADKEEVIAKARRIGTFETSILPFEDCCTVFTPKHPNTKPKLEKIKLSESKMDIELLIQNAIEGAETLYIK